MTVEEFDEVYDIGYTAGVVAGTALLYNRSIAAVLEIEDVRVRDACRRLLVDVTREALP